MPAPDEFTLLCERCGYEIEGLPTGGDCPECGKAIAESLPERRTGTPWQQGQNWRTLLRTGWMTVRAPVATLDVIRADEDLGKGQAGWLGLIAGAITSIPMILAIAVWGSSALSSTFTFVATFAFAAPVLMLAVSFSIAPVLWILTFIEARGIQFFAGRRGGRMTRAMAWSICGHGCIGWVLAAAAVSVGACTQIVAIALAWETVGPDVRWPMSFAAAFHIGTTLLLIGGLAGFLFFETFAWLGVRRCKFANRVRFVGPPPPSESAIGIAHEGTATQTRPTNPS